jgi:hypothetical protein
VRNKKDSSRGRVVSGLPFELNRHNNSVQVLMKHLFKKPLLIALYFFIIFNIVVNTIANIGFLLSLTIF